MFCELIHILRMCRLIGSMLGLNVRLNERFLETVIGWLQKHASQMVQQRRRRSGTTSSLHVLRSGRTLVKMPLQLTWMRHCGSREKILCTSCQRLIFFNSENMFRVTGKRLPVSNCAHVGLPVTIGKQLPVTAGNHLPVTSCA